MYTSLYIRREIMSLCNMKTGENILCMGLRVVEEPQKFHKCYN